MYIYVHKYVGAYPEMINIELLSDLEKNWLRIANQTLTNC